MTVRCVTPEIDLYAPATFTARPLPLPFLITCLWERVEVIRAIDGAPLGCVDELLAQARPFMATHALVRSLVQEIEASRG